ncbi:MAG: sulfite exporter TauE/SafE family protein [Limisphaerales bacterium]
MQLWTAFILGLAGSLHCAAMCGALALLVPVVGPTKSERVLSRITYNAGRLLTYTVLGALFGLFGRVLSIAGLQQWLSIGSGVLILLGLVVSMRTIVSAPVTRSVGWIRSKFGTLLRKRTLVSIGGLGALNGLLPCGLVYVACAGSASTGDAFSGIEYMFVFGLGTVPMLLGVGIGGASLKLTSFRLKRVVPIVAVVAGVLLIFRGLALGIPYVSPAAAGHCPACLHAHL